MIGQSGKTVRPILYMGIGISGVMHHVVGMDQSKHVITINSDPNADIFETSDVIVVPNDGSYDDNALADVARALLCWCSRWWYTRELSVDVRRSLSPSVYCAGVHRHHALVFARASIAFAVCVLCWHPSP